MRITKCADEGESGSGADDISRRAAACKREVPGGSVASAARCDGDGGSDPFQKYNSARVEASTHCEI